MKWEISFKEGHPWARFIGGISVYVIEIDANSYQLTDTSHIFETADGRREFKIEQVASVEEVS